uniref:Uncharacterized protein n=1 Tax=Zosterops lateralis melanops TaxID=1220523 RepID=A0A8D2P274_ZOSLA
MGGSKGLLSARLGCSVQEEDVGRRETFSAEWLDLELRTRPEDGSCEIREAQGGCPRGIGKVSEVPVNEWGLLMRLGVAGIPQGARRIWGVSGWVVPVGLSGDMGHGGLQGWGRTWESPGVLAGRGDPKGSG